MKKYIFLAIISFLTPNVLPVDGSNLNYTHVLFEWTQIENANSYEIQISEEIDFSSILTSESSQSLIYIEKNTIDWNSQYYWRVRGLDFENNFESDWSDTFSFTTSSKRSNANTTLLSADEYSEGITIFSSFLD